jgi:hypothetical protein
MTWRQAGALSGVNIVDTYANRPATGYAEGQRFVPKDSGPAFVWDAAANLWRPEFETTLGYEPPSTGWTAVDSGRGANVSFANGVLELAATSMGVGDAYSLAVRSFAGGAGDFDVRARLRQVMSLMGSSEVVVPSYLVSGLTVRDSVSGELTVFVFQGEKVSNAIDGMRNAIGVYRLNSTTSFNNVIRVHYAHNRFTDSAIWLRIQQVIDPNPSNSSIRFYTSNDGKRWWYVTDIYGGSRMPITPDQIGICHCAFVPSGSGAHDSGVRLESWEPS